MSLYIFFSITLLLMILQPVHSAHYFTPVATKGEGIAGTCPSQEKRNATIQNITASIRHVISQTTTFNETSNCGPGLWYKVASLNMSDPSQQCPSAWREYNTSGVRACGRPVTSRGSCPGVFYATNRQYSQVCGRAIGYQIGSPDAFSFSARGHTIDSYYVYGVSITHGSPRNHIWTYAAGTTEGDGVFGSNCPCNTDSQSSQALPPSFVGDNYYCESGNAGTSYQNHHLYNTDPLWDGQQCEGECCRNGKSPPWFSVALPNPTTDDIEVRICNAEGTRDDVPVQQLKLYIQ